LNTAAELTRIMGHKNRDKFFNDPFAINPQTGQLLDPPPPGGATFEKQGTKQKGVTAQVFVGPRMRIPGHRHHKYRSQREPQYARTL
jgi:hypothetical protein